MISYDYVCLSFSILQDAFGVRSLRTRPNEMMAALYLQVSIISQALIFVTRSRSWSFIERPGLLLATAFVIAQLVRVHFHLTNLNTTVHMGSSFVSVHDFLWYLFIETSSLSEMMHLFQKQTQSIFKYNESFSN